MGSVVKCCKYVSGTALTLSNLWYWRGWCISVLNEGQKNPRPPQNHRVAVEFKLQNSRHIWSLFSTRAEIAELLVAANGDVNAKAENAWTPLMLCCETANEVGLRILLKLKADPNALTYVTWRHLLEGFVAHWFTWFVVGKNTSYMFISSCE